MMGYLMGMGISLFLYDRKAGPFWADLGPRFGKHVLRSGKYFNIHG